jgi:hypothetical protein
VSADVAGSIRWVFSMEENTLCAGPPYNRSADEAFHEVSTDPPH